MNTSKPVGGFNQTLVALAVLAAFAPARAQDIAELAAPGNSISVGVGVATGDDKDRARFGMFNGLRTQKGHGLLGFSVVERDDATGKWFTVEGRNLGLDNRELGFSYRKLGDMKLWGDYSEIVRHDPRTINTGLIGPGSTTPTVQLLTAPGTGSEVNLELKRKSFSLNAEKWFNGALQMEVNFKNEDKDGARLFGKGFACTSVTVGSACAGPTATATGWALLLLPEPVNSTIRQIDVKLNWSGDKLRLSGGYYGSFYSNQNGNISPSVPGTLLNAVGTPLPLSTGLQSILNLPMALWPDNQAQQLHVAGNYRFTPKTLMNFKYAYTHATQNEDFLAMGLTGAPGGRANLGGVLDTTRAQIGISSHPWEKVHIRGDLKYESKNDKTPIALYNTEFNGTTAAATAVTYTNNASSPKRLFGRLEGSYKLPANYLGVGEVEYESEDFGAFTQTAALGGISAIRQKTEEKGYRIELRKVMSETLNGAISYHSSKREGNSPWLKPLTLSCQGAGGPANRGTGVTEANEGLVSVTTCATWNNGILGTATSKPIAPYFMGDRDRDKLRLRGSWSPNDRLSVDFWIEDGKDKYKYSFTDHGLRDTGIRFYAVDAGYVLSDKWRLTGYLSRGEQTTNAGHSTGYDATLTDTADSFGVALLGKPSGRLQVGADLMYLNDRLKYLQVQDPNASATNTAFLASSGGLPDVTYRLIRLKLFGEYAVDKTSFVRLDLIHQRSYFNEWTYNYNGVPFYYSDNTTLTSKQDQSVTFVGASYVYRFK